MAFVCLNGDYLPAAEARISVFDRGFAYGEGIFETIKFVRGRPVFFREHMARLMAGLLETGIAPVPDEQELLGQALELGRKNSVELGRLRMLVTRGTALESPGPDPTGELSANVLLTLDPFPGVPPEVYVSGVACRTAPLNRGPYARIKTSGLMQSILLRKEARAAGYWEVIFTGAEGSLLEGAYTNLFFLRDGALTTAAENEAILPGIIREKIIGIAAAIDLSVELRSLTMEDVKRSRPAGFLTSSLLGVCPVSHLDDLELASGGEIIAALAKGLAEEEEADLESPG